ncbi:MDR family MFS transporter [Sediminivirga luteola]|uniref:MFS transporter n=1 Tax=Sediminivirga luteola TaxID=1774748 RepID=A0A8J2XMC4_9MICO|nr:MDR family MFS transporter [Sediminivirga luteola]MCI2265026.1 multidrug efflux MFS transporter [Sediminivirga luteola]GGA25364.1 MFS transporter [Sediminivirga luteola]
MSQGHAAPPPGNTHRDPRAQRPWPALWALALGFFMILVDTTIVSVAIPAIIDGLHAELTTAVWVTSAYLLAFAVPLLVTGRLGDRFGPKTVYQTGLVVFTLASLACGLAGSAEALIGARVVQGLGAAMMTPQTMAVITRLFPPQNRGAAMGFWGSIAGVATLIGPILGGVLTDAFGWEWIFFVNIPVGVLAFILAARLVPRLDQAARRLDWPGVLLSAIGMLLLVFALQEGERAGWGGIPVALGPLHADVDVRVLLIVGVLVLIAFVLWQRRGGDEALVPPALFRDRNFTLGSIAIMSMGFTVTAQMFPIMLYLQHARELSPTLAALCLAPTALISVVLPPIVGRLLRIIDPKWVAMAGFGGFALGHLWLAQLMRADASLPWLLLPFAFFGLCHSCIWAPVSVTATRHLDPGRAGAGSGVYNTMRQIGAVLGSAGMAAMMEAMLARQEVDGAISTQGGEAPVVTALPAESLDAFGAAMSASVLLPAVVILIGFTAACLFRRAPAAHMRRR